MGPLERFAGGAPKKVVKFNNSHQSENSQINGGLNRKRKYSRQDCRFNFGEDNEIESHMGDYVSPTMMKNCRRDKSEMSSL